MIPPSLFDASHEPKTHNPDANALNILARVQEDPRFAASDERDEMNPYADTLRRHGPALVEYAAQWTIYAGSDELAKKIEQLGWMNSLIYSVAGWTGRNKGEHEKGRGFNADFLL